MKKLLDAKAAVALTSHAKALNEQRLATKAQRQAAQAQATRTLNQLWRKQEIGIVTEAIAGKSLYATDRVIAGREALVRMGYIVVEVGFMSKTEGRAQETLPKRKPEDVLKSAQKKFLLKAAYLEKGTIAQLKLFMSDYIQGGESRLGLVQTLWSKKLIGIDDVYALQEVAEEFQDAVKSLDASVSGCQDSIEVREFKPPWRVPGYEHSTVANSGNYFQIRWGHAESSIDGGNINAVAASSAAWLSGMGGRRFLARIDDCIRAAAESGENSLELSLRSERQHWVHAGKGGASFSVPTLHLLKQVLSILGFQCSVDVGASGHAKVLIDWL